MASTPNMKVLGKRDKESGFPLCVIFQGKLEVKGDLRVKYVKAG